MPDSGVLEKVRALVGQGDVLISAHGYEEMAAEEISIEDALAGIGAAEIVEEYPAAAKGPSVLVLEHDGTGAPFHVVWGVPKDCDRPAVLVTAYRPDPARWSDDLRRRRK